MDYPKDVHLVCKVTPTYYHFKELESYIVTEDCLIPFEVLNVNTVEDNQNVNRRINSDLNDIVPRSDHVHDFLNHEMPYRFCRCIRRLAFYRFLNGIEAFMCPILFSLIMHELNRSKAFRKNILLYFYSRNLSSRRRKNVNRKHSCLSCAKLSKPMHVIVYLEEPKEIILDYKWGRKMQRLVNERCELENAMAWLSTLGGAFSALGDSSKEWAVKAGTISMQQLYIALRIGDPLTICRCKIYLAMSLLQRGYYKKTKQMIRELYNFSVGFEGSKDFRLRNMCLAVWNRLRYVLSQKACKQIKAQ